MTRKSRKLLLIVASAIFLLAVPIILLYSIGYSLDWQNKTIVKTGGFYLKSTPSKAEIFINDKFKGKTNRFIKRLLPRDYNIKIEKPEYHSWQKSLKINSQLVTEARSIVLFPINPKIEILKTDLESDFSLEVYLTEDKTSPDHFLINNDEMHAGFTIVDDEIYYIQKPSYVLYKSNLDGSNQVQLSVSALPQEMTYQIIYSPHRPAVLSENQDLYLLEEDKTFERLAQNIEKAQFAHDNKKMIYSSATEIWVIYFENILVQPNKMKDEKELITRLSKPITNALWYSATNEHIIFTVNGHIKIAELDGRDQRNIIDFIDSSPDQIIYDHQDKLLYYTEDNSLKAASLEKD